MDKKRFGSHLAYFRKKNGMTQMQLAERVNCSLSTISRLESGLEIPKLQLFEKFNKVFEGFGITYEELSMEEIFEFQRAKEELLIAIQNGRAEELDRKLMRFKELMDEEDLEHKQYYVLGYLVYMRKNGMTIEEFLDRITALFEIRRKLPKLHEISELKLSRIEYMMIYKMGLAHMSVGNDKQAMEYIKELIICGFGGDTEYLKNRTKDVATSYAQMLIRNNQFVEAEKCINYVMERIAENTDTRLFFQSLILQEKLFVARGDVEGAKLIKDFIEVAERLVNYMQHKAVKACDL
ncbi:helix-turn-helix domain-containing protein [Pseudobutyrivibrio sp. MD2005]|uniref:helix-turn-helix domain-containing protein n=1 Tax=Pseudobutyrivibrio sp. MD2005 TaxID=1410616 RepID=UPI00055C0907|nr:helix-turn-helix transcriptional regulator [Pseudobutyrivibrio sp. MD2005]